MPRVSEKVDVEGVLPALGRVIRARRKANGYSQEEFADLTEIDRSHMGRIERGERNVSILNLARIARALNLRLADIIAEAGL
jgi:transcriptional regulator with XRE-family HTH domain